MLVFEIIGIIYVVCLIISIVLFVIATAKSWKRLEKKIIMSKTLRHLWVERSLYLIPRSSKDVLMLIQKVFMGVEDTAGLITFDGKKYKINNVDIFERFLTFWLMSLSGGESDPLLNIDSDIPVELQISQDLTPHKVPKVYNHEKPQS